MKSKLIYTTEGRRVRRVSRWIKIRTDYTRSPRHELAEYAEPDGRIDYFIHRGKRYALAQFLRMTWPMFYRMDDGREGYISAYDGTTWYRPYLLEMDEYGEYVRLYEEDKEGWREV